MPEHALASEIEIITDGGRRRRWTAAEKLTIVEETMIDRVSISVVARQSGVGPNLVYHSYQHDRYSGSASLSSNRRASYVAILDRRTRLFACQWFSAKLPEGGVTAPVLLY